MSKIILTGAFGYEGWPLLQKLVSDGHEVLAIDDNSREINVESIGSISAIPIDSGFDKAIYCEKNGIKYCIVDLSTHGLLEYACKINNFFDFDIIIHLAAQPSMPYSMMYPNDTLHNNNEAIRNIVNFIKEYNKDAHLVFTSTMGEYGTPNKKIDAGYLDTLDGARLNFPRDPSSYYHLSKVYDSQYILLSHKLWGLKATIMMQGVVFGTKTSWINSPTRWDFDYYFGTVLNRFMAQTIIGEPMSVYGSGEHSRGLLHLEDACLGISEIIKWPKTRSVDFYNHITMTFKIKEMAALVQDVGMELGLEANLNYVKNPRKEAEYHQYDVETFSMSAKYDFNIYKEVKEDMKTLLKHKQRILNHKESMNKK